MKIKVHFRGKIGNFVHNTLGARPTEVKGYDIAQGGNFIIFYLTSGDELVINNSVIEAIHFVAEEK